MSETHDLRNGYVLGEELEVTDEATASSSAASEFAAAGTLPPDADMVEEEPLHFDALASLSRLIAGLAIEGTLELLAILQAWEEENGLEQRLRQFDEGFGAAEKTRFVMLGLLVEAAQHTRKTAVRLTRFGTDMGRWWFTRLRPLSDSILMRPTKKRYLQLVGRSNKVRQRWLETGRFQEAQGRALARSTTGKIIDRVVGHLEYNGRTQELIRTQADTYLQFLTDNPEPVRQLINNEVGAFLGELEGDPSQLDGLVQEVADRYVEYMRENPTLIKALIEEQADQYLDYLQENPEQVQTLIQDQSLDMAGEIMDEVRVRTVTIDTLMERLVRGVFRRQPRTAVTPPEVRRLAEHTPRDELSDQPDTQEDVT